MVVATVAGASAAPAAAGAPVLSLACDWRRQRLLRLRLLFLRSVDEPLPRLRLCSDPTSGDRFRCGVLLRLTATAARPGIPVDTAEGGGSCFLLWLPVEDSCGRDVLV